MIPNQGHNGQAKHRVLVVANADGFIELFAERRFDCHFVNRPKMMTPRGGDLADDYIEAVIPRRFRSLFFPSFCRATGNVRPVRPDQLAAGRLSLLVSKALSQIGSKTEGAAV